jgi:hypothetical protein
MQSVSEDERPPQPSRTTKPSAGKGKGRAVDEEEREEEEEMEEADVQQEIGRNTKEANESSRVNGRGGDSIGSLQKQLRDLKSKLSEVSDFGVPHLGNKYRPSTGGEVSRHLSDSAAETTSIATH